MPRGKRKCAHPPLTFLHPPFSKQLGEIPYVPPSELHPEVKTANADEKCSWISPTFKLDHIQRITNRNQRNTHPKPPLPVTKMTLEFVDSSKIAVEGPSRCPLFPLKSPESIQKKEVILVPETPTCQN